MLGHVVLNLYEIQVRIKCVKKQVKGRHGAVDNFYGTQDKIKTAAKPKE
jgi:hypothetical protein